MKTLTQILEQAEGEFEKEFVIPGRDWWKNIDNGDDRTINPSIVKSHLRTSIIQAVTEAFTAVEVEKRW